MCHPPHFFPIFQIYSTKKKNTINGWKRHKWQFGSSREGKLFQGEFFLEKANFVAYETRLFSQTFINAIRLRSKLEKFHSYKFSTLSLVSIFWISFVSTNISNLYETSNWIMYIKRKVCLISVHMIEDAFIPEFPSVLSNFSICLL